MITVLRHGTVCESDGSLRSYYGWPSVAKMSDGTLVAVASGERMAHICPWGRTTMWISKDQGMTWSNTKIINDSPIDDRDAGVIALNDGRLLVSWFTSDTRIYLDSVKSLAFPKNDLSLTVIRGWDNELMNRYLGAYVMTGTLDGGWDDPVEIGITTPHGPIQMENGDLLYFGKAFLENDGPERKMRGVDYAKPLDRSLNEHLEQPIVCAVSRDGGRNWETMGYVDKLGGFENTNLHEPHVVCLPGGRLVGVIRTQWSKECKFHKQFSMALTYSDDGGRNWSELKPLDVSGSPPHLLLHSSGVLILTYGYRAGQDTGVDIGSGQRVLLSYDGGTTWSEPEILRDDGPDSDLGYPCTAELDDGSLITVYYQKAKAGENTSIMYTVWKL